MYQLVIGLEVHIKLSSWCKLFCGCVNEQDFETLKPNTHICPVCTWQPWALPVLQKEPLAKALLLWKALNCTINPLSRFDRKSYFYPDLPAGYQITQNFQPSCVEGHVSFFDAQFDQHKTVRIKQAHIETDTGKTLHIGSRSLLDFNRAGTPLVEIVTYPDFWSSEEVIEFLKELQRIIRFNHIGDCDLEKGHMRVDVNISVKKPEEQKFRTRVELKNINSFGAIKRAIEYEYHRQCDIYNQWWVIEQETRRRDDVAGINKIMRSKADALDYRYFPDPDLPALHLTHHDDGTIMSGETIICWPHAIIKPFELAQIYKDHYQFSKEFLYGIMATRETFLYFYELVWRWTNPKNTAKWIVGPLAAWSTKHNLDYTHLPFTIDQFFDFLMMIENGSINDAAAKKIIDQMLISGGHPVDIKEKLWLGSMSDEAIEEIIASVMANNDAQVKAYREGKTQLLWFFIGQVMKATEGKADPQHIQHLITRHLAW